MRTPSPDLTLYLALYTLLFVLQWWKTIAKRRAGAGAAADTPETPTWHDIFFFSSDVVIAAGGIAILLTASKYVGTVVFIYLAALIATLLIDMSARSKAVRLRLHSLAIGVVVLVTCLLFVFVIEDPRLAQRPRNTFRVAIPYGDLTLDRSLGGPKG